MRVPAPAKSQQRHKFFIPVLLPAFLEYIPTNETGSQPDRAQIKRDLLHDETRIHQRFVMGFGVQRKIIRRCHGKHTRRAHRPVAATDHPAFCLHPPEKRQYFPAIMFYLIQRLYRQFFHQIMPDRFSRKYRFVIIHTATFIIS